MTGKRGTLGMATAVIMFGIIVFLSQGCSNNGSSSNDTAGIQSTDDTADSGTGSIDDNSGSTEDPTGPSCLTVLADDFSGSLSDHWTIGTNSLENPAGPAVDTENGRVKFSQAHDYIETIDAVSGNFTLSVDVFQDAGTQSCADFFIELVAAGAQAALFHFSHGDAARVGINIGAPPTMDTEDTWDCIMDPPYLQELGHDGGSAGTISMTYANQAIQVAFTNDQGETITTPVVPTDSITDTTIRIWGNGESGANRYMDNLTVCEWQGNNGPWKTDDSGQMPSPQAGQDNGSNTKLSGTGTCSDSEITLTIGNETKTLSLAVTSGFEQGEANLYGCVWHSQSYGDQLLINGISSAVSPGGVYTMNGTDPLKLSLVWNNMLYMPKAFTLSFDRWDGPGGNAGGTLSATLYNVMLDKTMILKDVAFCGPILYSDPQ